MSEDLDLGLGLTWTAAEAGLDPFDLSADEYVSTHPFTLYDFSETHEYSDLETEQLDLELDVRYRLTSSFWLSGRYRLVDFDDDDPYLYDLTGSVDFLQLAMGWSF